MRPVTTRLIRSCRKLAAFVKIDVLSAAFGYPNGDFAGGFVRRQNVTFGLQICRILPNKQKACGQDDHENKYEVLTGLDRVIDC